MASKSNIDAIPATESKEILTAINSRNIAENETIFPTKKNRILKGLHSHATKMHEEKNLIGVVNKQGENENTEIGTTEKRKDGEAATGNKLVVFMNEKRKKPSINEAQSATKASPTKVTKENASAEKDEADKAITRNESLFYPNASTPGACQDESSNDSTSLQIVLSPPSKKGSKRKKGEAFNINKEIEDDIEKELEKKAKKSNLTVKNVKSILKYVIGNESVLEMVKKVMDESGGSGSPCEYELKLTRSKARQLREEKQIMWPLSPIRPPTPVEPDDHLVLIREELPEEEDDDEYKPTADDLLDHSDDDTGRNSVSSSLNSSTVGHYLENFDPALLETSKTHMFDAQTSNDGVDFCFKRPVEKKLENIGQRTRSKFSLSSTPLETIEQAFVPPDVTNDMYEFKCGDQEWENFLKEFMQPLSENSTDADVDEEDDPEYNVLGEVEKVDREELRRDKGVHISRAELATLVMELFEGPEEGSSDDEGAKETDAAAESTLNIEEISKKLSVADVIVVEEDPPSPPPPVIGVTLSQKLLLQQQLRQHVQLLTQHFLQTHENLSFSRYAPIVKRMLSELLELGKINSKSVLNVYNLPKAFELIEVWEKVLLSPFRKEILEHFKNEYEQCVTLKKKRYKHIGKFHPAVMDIIVNSDVFLYPRLLPSIPFRFEVFTSHEFIPSDDNLIALGLEQFVPYVKEYPLQHHKKCPPNHAAVFLIQSHMLPGQSVARIWRRIKALRDKKESPIWYVMNTGKAPETVHHVIPFNPMFLVPPKKQGKELLPPIWREYVKNIRKKEKKK